MKKAFYLVLLAALLVLPSAAMGQSGVNWDAGILIQNVGSAEADVTIYYYNNEADGGGLNTSVNYTIPMGSAITVYPLDVADGFMRKEGAYWNEAALAGKTPLLNIQVNLALGSLKVVNL